MITQRHQWVLKGHETFRHLAFFFFRDTFYISLVTVCLMTESTMTVCLMTERDHDARRVLKEEEKWRLVDDELR